MDGNKIANITNATFVGLKSLRSISLRDNILGSLQENLFVFLTKVRRLMYYQGNQIFIPIRYRQALQCYLPWLQILLKWYALVRSLSIYFCQNTQSRVFFVCNLPKILWPLFADLKLSPIVQKALKSNVGREIKVFICCLSLTFLCQYSFIW